VSVSDLYAFDATIGGFVIDEDSIHSNVKDSVDNTTEGIYLDNDGQIAFGDSENYVKYYKDVDDTRKLDVAAQSVKIGGSAVDLDGIKDDITETAARIETAEVNIDTINSTIESLIVGKDGTTLMTQTDEGWRFDMSSFQESLDNAAENIGDLSERVDGTDKTVEDLKNDINNLNTYTDYIKIGTDDNDHPCILLGETDSDFEVAITNTAIDFKEGSNVPARISNQSMYIEKAEIKKELKHGGFVWAGRNNGNWGILWKGE
jgi:archaellum component FlaC